MATESFVLITEFSCYALDEIDLARARTRLARGIGSPLLLTGCMPRPPPMRFGDAHDAGRRPQALRRAPRAPFAPAVLAGCAREGVYGPLQPRVNMM